MVLQNLKHALILYLIFLISSLYAYLYRHFSRMTVSSHATYEFHQTCYNKQLLYYYYALAHLTLFEKIFLVFYFPQPSLAYKSRLIMIHDITTSRNAKKHPHKKNASVLHRNALRQAESLYGAC